MKEINFSYSLGIIDILTMELLNYDKEKNISKLQLTEANYPKYWEKASSLRSEVIDKLTNHDDDLADLVIKSESLDSISTVDVVNTLRRVTNKQVCNDNISFERLSFNVHKDCHSSFAWKFLQKCWGTVFDGCNYIIPAFAERTE